MWLSTLCLAVAWRVAFAVASVVVLWLFNWPRDMPMCGCSTMCVCECMCVIVGSSLAFARHLGMAKPKACASQLFVLAIRLTSVFACNETENIKPKPERQMKNQYYCKLACVACYPFGEWKHGIWFDPLTSVSFWMPLLLCDMRAGDQRNYSNHGNHPLPSLLANNVSAVCPWGEY